MLFNHTIIYYEKAIVLFKKMIVFKDRIIALPETQNERCEKENEALCNVSIDSRPNLRVVWKNEEYIREQVPDAAKNTTDVTDNRLDSDLNFY